MHSAKACAALYRADLPQLLSMVHMQQLPVSALQFSGYSGSQKLSAVDLSGLDSGSRIVMSALKRLKLDLSFSASSHISHNQLPTSSNSHDITCTTTICKDYLG